MKLGIIGLPGAGKNTVFEALTRIPPEGSAHKPEHRIGTVRVPDERVDFLSAMFKPRKTIYAKVEYFLPFTGLRQKDRGLDENVLAVIRTCDALIHVVKNFKTFAEDEPNPEQDFSDFDQEMIFADLMVVEKRLERLEADRKRNRKPDPEEERLLAECRKMLENEIPLRKNVELAAAHLLKGYTFLSAKPQLVLFNNEENNSSLPATGEIVDNENYLTLCASLEHELSQMSEAEAQEYQQEFGISASAMNRVISVSYNILGQISFFTVGEDEVRAWTISKDTLALDAAEVIHSDIKKGFIRAEVLAYDDLVAAGSYKEARSKGTVRLEGKTYPVKDGDIIEFRFNV